MRDEVSGMLDGEASVGMQENSKVQYSQLPRAPGRSNGIFRRQVQWYLSINPVVTTDDAATIMTMMEALANRGRLDAGGIRCLNRLRESLIDETDSGEIGFRVSALWHPNHDVSMYSKACFHFTQGSSLL